MRGEGRQGVYGDPFRFLRQSVLHAKLLQSCPAVWLYGLQPTRLHCPRASPGQNTRVRCHALLQGTFPAQGWNLRLLP